MSETTYSYSRISTYGSCPFKFKLHYLDGNYARTDSLATMFGTAMHEAEEAIANSFMNETPIDYVAIKNKFIMDCVELEHKFPKDFKTVDPKCNKTYTEKMYAYLDSGVYRLEKYMKDHPTVKIIGAEVSYNVEINNEKFVAKIDRLMQDTATGMYILQDIKSWSEPKEEEITTPVQFVVYSLAVQKQFNCTEDQIICQYDLPILEQYFDAGTKGFMKRGLAKLEKWFNGIYAKDYTPNPQPLCNWCGYSLTSPEAPAEHRFKCPYFCHWTRDTRNKFDISSLETKWTGIENYPTDLALLKQKYNIQ